MDFNALAYLVENVLPFRKCRYPCVLAWARS